eukprot:3318800-Lingulodinium_polyedra.AAC.1
MHDPCLHGTRGEMRMEPPIRTEYFRSGNAATKIFIAEGANAVGSLALRSPTPLNTLAPPENTTFEQ